MTTAYGPGTPFGELKVTRRTGVLRGGPRCYGLVLGDVRKAAAYDRSEFSSTLIAGRLFATAGESLGHPGGSVKAIAFYAFAVLDPPPVFALAEPESPAERLFPRSQNALRTLEMTT